MDSVTTSLVYFLGKTSIMGSVNWCLFYNPIRNKQGIHYL